MKRKTLSMAKNLMRRALADVIDPPPSEAEQQQLREHFANVCCYCGADARPRDGHIDHAAADAGNSLGNLVLACRTCNGDEKREMGWEQFLRSKCGADDAGYAERLARIRTWFDLHPAERRRATPEVDAARRVAEEAIATFEAAYKELRRVVAVSRAGSED
jgi:hypothetical protein